MSRTILFAWVVPAYSSGSPVDHTWVTTYDSSSPASPYASISEVTAAGQCYWYCWGEFHPQGGIPGNETGYIGHQEGDLDCANCLVEPNVASSDSEAARGTIYTYGKDGVCHQLANQVLYATRVSGSEALTVAKARGYAASTFLYGTYGRQESDWRRKIELCAADTMNATARGDQSMSSEPDEFEQHLRKVLGPKEDALIAELLDLRHKAFAEHADARSLQNGQAPTAEALNADNQKTLRKAAELLGEDRFQEIFGFPSAQGIDLVDPQIMRLING
jgi:hypothetical protein